MLQSSLPSASARGDVPSEGTLVAPLPVNPARLDLEDFVAAHLVSRGVFVETGITERDPVDILELDIVWTEYRQRPIVPRPVHVKSGQWSLSDLFKYTGWAHYLGLDVGDLVCRSLPGRVPPPLLDRLTQRLGIRLVHVDSLDSADDRFGHVGLGTPPLPFLPELWRYSFWAQRRLFKSIQLAVERGICPQSATAAKEYWRLINDAIFFEPDFRLRISMLLDA